MTGNLSFLLEFKEIDGGYVAFGGNPKGGKISGKGKIKTGKLDFDDVYFVKEIKFNLFSVSQIMYNVDLKNVVPSGGLTCLFAKATLDESNLWHRRLGHINFKTMNKLVKGNLVRGIGPKWSFDIDTLTMSMNYHPVVVGNQPNDNAGIKENLNACKVRKDTISTQQYVLLPLWSSDSQDLKNTDDNVVDDAFEVKENENDVYVSANESDTCDKQKHDEKAKRDDKGKSPVDLLKGVRDLRAEFEEFSFNNTNMFNAVSDPINAAGLNPTNSTNIFNAASPSVNAVSPNFRIAGQSPFIDPSKYPDDPEMPELEDIVYSDDKEDVGAEDDLSNLETNIPVSPILTIRVHKDHPVNQIIGALNDKNEPKKVLQALKDSSWIEAMQEELLQFKLPKVWVLVDLPKGKRAIGSKWVFRNKKDERGIVIRNKARLVAQGHTQEEGIYYNEFFTPVARIESIRLFLAYASFMGFMELCTAFEKLMKDTFQMSYMGELTFFLGLQVKQKKDEIFISQDKYVAKILRNFGFTDVKSASTPIETEKPLLKDLDGEDVDVHLYSAKRIAWNEFSSSMASAIICLAIVLLDHQADEMTNHNTRYKSPDLTQKVFANIRRVRKGFSGVETPLFDFMLVQSQQQAEAGIELKKRVKRLERKKKSKTLGLKRLRRVGADQRVESSSDIVLGEKNLKDDIEELFYQENVNAASKRVSAVIAHELVSTDEPTMFDDEDVTMKMAQTLIKLKADKARILNEKIAQKLHDKENMVGYKMKFFKGMTYDEIRPIFEREYNKIQTLFKQDKDVEKTNKKRVANEALLQESFKKLRAAEIIKVGGITEAYQIFEDMIKGFDRKDLVALWNLVKERFSSAEPIKDKERALWVELKRLFESDVNDVLWKLQIYMHAPLTWRLYSDCGVHHVFSTRGHDIYMLTEKDCPLSNAIMILMLSGKLQVEEDNEMARDLVMKIFMEANRPRNISV
nr:ribonuclease H-like domain-containing protein [Tanacetum cinerariifolium]